MRRPPAILLACLGLAACLDPADPSDAARQALQDGRASLAALGLAPAAGREGERALAGRDAAAPPPPELELRLAGPAPAQASALAGHTPEAVLARLGEPALRRQEGSAHIWLYTAGGCQVDVIFYPGAGGLRVGFAQARAGGLAQRSEAACLRDVAAEGRRRSGGGAALAPGAAPADLGA
ncbi:MAG: hypothetical protein N2588_00680 [Rhodovarius sp.]|nr:hypothetical protein [Rhodovarius sp.]